MNMKSLKLHYISLKQSFIFPLVYFFVASSILIFILILIACVNSKSNEQFHILSQKNVTFQKLVFFSGFQ